jgi:hypothetical protein
MIDRKIPGIEDNLVDSKQVISFYTENIQSHIDGKKPEDRAAYIPVLELLEEYKGFIKNEMHFVSGKKLLPIRQDHFNNDDEKVDFFLQQICDICIPTGYLLRDTFTFNLLWYVGQYHVQNALASKLENENKQLKLENEKLKKNALEKQQSTIKFESDLQNTNTALAAKLKKAEENLEDEKCKCLDLLNERKKIYEDRANELTSLCEEEDETKINKLKARKDSVFPDEMLQNKIVELKRSLIQQKQDYENLVAKHEKDLVDITTRKKISPYTWFLAGLITSFLLLKGYAYFF